MARRVFFSFHYERDVRRVMQVHNSWLVRSRGEAQPFYDKAEFEEAKKRGGGLERWIEEQMKSTSVTVVLFGAETYEREWVRHEIKRSVELGKGLLAIDIHRVKDPQLGGDVAGKNPLDHWRVERNGGSVPLSQVYATSDWARNNGYDNITARIEASANWEGC